MNNPFYYQPSADCIEAAHAVCAEIERMPQWREEVQRGKMFGILIAEDSAGQRVLLKAYSGQILGRADWDGWVPAVFDYLKPDGYFKTNEARISAINRDISEREASAQRSNLLADLQEARDKATSEIDAYREKIAMSKAQRHLARECGCADEETLIRQSQHEKAELKRLKKYWDELIAPLQHALDEYDGETRSLRLRRSHESDLLQKWLFTQFVMINGRGEQRNLLEIFGTEVPPAGTGECCAPKLLQYAFQNGLRPISIAEFWYGDSPRTELRHHLTFYPACQGKCRPVLDFMLQGIDVEPNPLEEQESAKTVEIIYEDNRLLAVNKPAGMLSAPGKGNRRCVIDVLRSMGKGELLNIHRLDMQTSGVLLLAKDAESQRYMRSLFERRLIHKEYYAVLDGVWHGPKEGVISLPLSPDYLNRPRQYVDFTHGKEAVTHYHIEKTECGHTHVRLYPKTGRTHQLRVHCAHPSGFGIPIVGDDLYGRHADRLQLYAIRLGPLPDGTVICCNYNEKESL